MIIYPIANKHKAGIYILKNIINNKIYIGQSMNLKQRLHAHISLSKNINENSQIIHKAIHKYGIKNFVFYPIIIKDSILTTRDELNILEKAIIYEFKTTGYDLYNVAEGGIAGNLGSEAKNKISKKLKNRKFTKEWREKISKALTGRKIPKTQIEKAINTHKMKYIYKKDSLKACKYPTKSHSAWNKGKKMTDEWKKKHPSSCSKGYKWYNNGEKEIFSKENPGENWKLGKLPYKKYE